MNHVAAQSQNLTEIANLLDDFKLNIKMGVKLVSKHMCERFRFCKLESIMIVNILIGQHKPIAKQDKLSTSKGDSASLEQKRPVACIRRPRNMMTL